MSTHNICFRGEIRKIVTGYSPLSRPMSPLIWSYGLSDAAYSFHQHIGLDENGYQVNIFLISPQKHMLWVLIGSASLRCL